jgi:hypothetical protein
MQATHPNVYGLRCTAVGLYIPLPLLEALNPKPWVRVFG